MLLEDQAIAGLLRGHTELEETGRGLRPHRLRKADRSTPIAAPQLQLAESQTAGVRIVARTTASNIALDVHSTWVDYFGAPQARGRVDLVIDGHLARSVRLAEGDVLGIDLVDTGPSIRTDGGDFRVVFGNLPRHAKTIEIWLPHGEAIELLGLSSDEPLHPVPVTTPRWVHGGSSISQGTAATSPTATWPATAARLAGVELHNLGFGGSMLLQESIARTVAAAPAEVVSVKVGINLVNDGRMRLDEFERATHAFLDIVRGGHPDVPLLLVSPILAPVHEDTPGPSSAVRTETGIAFVADGDARDDGALTLRRVRTALGRVVTDRRDERLTSVDGTTLYGAADAEWMPLPDGLHPDTATHRRIGERFARHLRDACGNLHGGWSG